MLTGGRADTPSMLAATDLVVAPPCGVINDDSWMASLALRGGSRVVYAEDAVSVRQVSASPTDEIARRSRMFAGQFQVPLWEKVARKQQVEGASIR
jgi:hypothetical protein